MAKSRNTKPPSVVKIGHRRFALNFAQPGEKGVDFTYAAVDEFEGNIYINQDMEGTKVADAVMHECLHAFNHTHGILFGDTSDPEEHAVNSSSGSWTTILSDNPKLRKWWVSLF